MKKSKKILLSICAFLFSFCLTLPYFINNNKKVNATMITTQSINLVLPSFYYPLSVGNYSYYYVMPIYIGCNGGNIVINYPRSSDSRNAYYMELAQLPTSDEINHFLLGGFVGAIKNGDYTYYGNFRNNANVTVQLNFRNPDINIFDYPIDNPLFFDQLQSMLNYISVQMQGTTIYYSFYNYQDELIWYMTLTDLQATTIDTAFVQRYTPIFLQSSINVDIYAQQLIDYAFKQGNDKGYNDGYQDGYYDGIEDATHGKIYTFKDLIGAVIDVPINSFKSLLNFDFLGINILDFVLSLITLFLVIKVVGIINGK